MCPVSTSNLEHVLNRAEDTAITQAAIDELNRLRELNHYLITHLAQQSPASLEVAAMVDRPLARRVAAQLSAAALNQSCLSEAPVSIIFTAIYERTTAKYGERGIRYVHMEAGHASQNVYLQAAAMNLSTVAIGAFHQQKVQRVLDLPENEQPLYIMPIGKRRS